LNETPDIPEEDAFDAACLVIVKSKVEAWKKAQQLQQPGNGAIHVDEDEDAPVPNYNAMPAFVCSEAKNWGLDAAEDPAARPIWSLVANKIARSPKPTKDTFVLTQDEVSELEKTQPRSIASMEDIISGDFCRQEVDRNEKIPYFSDATVPYGLLCACAHFITAVKVDEAIWKSLKNLFQRAQKYNQGIHIWNEWLNLRQEDYN
jgi:hypothetical protein